MAQKTKVKELVGRSLSSYHTKALQQIERIEKKNKEQNHKINILTGELDKDYITKTAEGSVVSLEHSKEGMVYLDELQGNTLVNYCTDGSKEITLNGDIDVEGTFVTTTEGVDNGKVDVMCEGNTLVNLATYGHKYQISVGGNNVTAQDVFTMTEQTVKTLKGTIDKNLSESGASYIYFQLGRLNMGLLKPSTTYTIFLDSKTDFLSNISIQEGNTSNKHSLTSSKVNKNTFVITTKSSFDGLDSKNNLIYGHYVTTYKGDVDVSVIAVLEGDYSNKPIPLHFEGMKSVGQDGENSHKIEILSNNGNLYKRLENSHYKVYGSTVTIIEENENGFIYKAEEWDMGLSYLISTEGLFKNKKYRLSWEGNNNTPNAPLLHSDGIKLLDSNKSFKEIISWDDFDYLEYDFKLPDSFEQGDILEIRFKNGALSVENGACNICINEIGVAKNTVISKLNKKEILINEPLRSLPNGVKDRMVKIGGKYFIERNCVEIDLNTINSWRSWGDKETEYYGFYQYVRGLKSIVNEREANVCCNTRPCITSIESIRSSTGVGIHAGSGNPDGYIAIAFKRSELTQLNNDGIKEWFSSNPTKVVAQLEIPTYEPLEVEPVLNTYNDITHISNNSIIPCNMKVKNSGYNAIIKPNTLYTVALDTNKAGTIGMNLGGAKVTTTNNVATITTPAILTDDSLRLYGKGIKGSKIRLLEGDKTNWIPSHFEGMKSSFEDKVQEDGSYKMEILMNNENLFDSSKYRLAQRGSVVVTYDEKSKTYTVNNTGSGDGRHQGDWGASTFYDSAGKPESRENLLFLKCKKGDKISIKARGTFSSIYVMERNNYNTTMKSFTYDKQEVVHTVSQECTTRLEIVFIHPTLGTVFTVKDIQVGYLDNVFENYIDNKHNKIQFSSIEPLRSVPSARDKFIFKDGKLTIERNCDVKILTGSSVGENWTIWGNSTEPNLFSAHAGNTSSNPLLPNSDVLNANNFKCDNYSVNGNVGRTEGIGWYSKNPHLTVHKSKAKNVVELKEYLRLNPITMVYKLEQPTYEEIPFELQKIILEGYENGTLFLDTNIPPTATVTYAGETPIAKSVKANKTEVSNNTADINDNILPYLMDMDYRIVMLQLATEELKGEVSMARLFGGTYEMLKRDILSKRLSRQEYGYRLADYFNAGKLTEEQVRELEELR